MSTHDPASVVKQLFPTARRLLTAASLRKLDLASCRRVLVIGAGHDPYSHLFEAPDLYLRLDIRAIPGKTDVVGDALTLPFGEGHFDCVLAVEILEHVAHPDVMVQEAHRVLAAGGLLVLTVPFMFHEHGDPSDFWRPTRFTLEKLLCEFEEVRIVAQGNRAHVISDLISTAWGSILFPIRVINHVLVPVSEWLKTSRRTTSPSGYLATGRKVASTL
jgi:SAM-dependent methyltransferase